MFGGEAFRYGSFFGGRTVIFCWYTCEVGVQDRGGNVDRYVKFDWLRRPRGIPNVILEDTRDICTQDVRSIEQVGLSIKTNHFERLGVSASHGFLRGCRDVQTASRRDEM